MLFILSLHWLEVSLFGLQWFENKNLILWYSFKIRHQASISALFRCPLDVPSFSQACHILMLITSILLCVSAFQPYFGCERHLENLYTFLVGKYKERFNLVSSMWSSLGNLVTPKNYWAQILALLSMIVAYKFLSSTEDRVTQS